MTKQASTINLKNGIRVVFVEEKTLKDTGLGVGIPAGVYWEEENHLGTSHLLEHLISRLEVNGASLRETIYKTGGVFDAATSISHTYFFLYALNQDFHKSVEAFIRGIFYPNFREGALIEAKESIISEMAETRRLTAYEVLRSLMWTDPKLKRSLVGQKETLLTLGMDDIVNYHRLRYLTPGVSVVVIGPKLPKYIISLLESIDMQSQGIESLPLPTINSPQYRIFEDGDLHSTLTLAFPTKGYKDLGEGRHLFRLAANVLNSTYISSLAKAGFIYKSNWSWNVFPTSGEFILEFPDLAAEHTPTVIKTVAGLVDDWSKLKISQTEFSLIKKQRILAVRMVEGLSESLPLITKDFSSSSEAHTFEEAIGVYRSAKLITTLKTAARVLLTSKPFLVVDMGDDSLKYTTEIKGFLDNYYGS